jgi:hypothetical protein
MQRLRRSHTQRAYVHSKSVAQCHRILCSCSARRWFLFGGSVLQFPQLGWVWRYGLEPIYPTVFVRIVRESKLMTQLPIALQRAVHSLAASSELIHAR